MNRKRRFIIVLLVLSFIFALSSCSFIGSILNNSGSSEKPSGSTNNRSVTLMLGYRRFENNALVFDGTFFNNTGKTIYGLKNANIKIYVNSKLRADANFETIRTIELKTGYSCTATLPFSYDTLLDYDWWYLNKNEKEVVVDLSYELYYSPIKSQTSTGVPSTVVTSTSNANSTSTTSSSTSLTTSQNDELTASISKTNYEFTYGITTSEIKNEISSNIETNGVASFTINSVDCGTQTINITFQKGSQTQTKTVNVTINPNDNGLQAYASTQTDAWYWKCTSEKFEFNIYFKNNTGKAISSFDADIVYVVDDYVRAVGIFKDNKLNNNQTIKNGEEFTFTFTIDRNSSYVTYSKSTWLSYYKTQPDILYTGYDYDYWRTISPNTNHNLSVVSYYSLNYVA